MWALIQVIMYTNESSINLTQQGQEYARFTNVVISDSVMSFTLLLGDCDDEYKTEKDETYDETLDPITGTVTETVGCNITGELSTGPISQIVTSTYAITSVSLIFSTNCTETLNINAEGLPPGITLTEIYDNCCVDIQGTPTADSSGTYVYSITASNNSTSFTVSGSIQVIQEELEVCTYTTLTLIDGQLDQFITLGNAITPTTLQLETDCPSDENNVPLNSISSGLPSGVNYSFDGQNNLIIISGTPELKVSTIIHNLFQ